MDNTPMNSTNIMMIRYTSLFVVITLLLTNSFLFAQNERQVQQPNFIVIFTDDLGYGDVGADGSELIQTPHIDRMEKEGIRLTNHYSSANVCTPSRAGLLTGRYAIRYGLAHRVLFPDSEHGLPHDEITLAGALQGAGYRTGMYGKWHLGTIDVSWPTDHGFDEFYGIAYSNDMVPLPLYRNREILEEPLDQTTITKRLTYEAIDFIKESPDEPFFIYLPHPMPHVPLYTSEEFEGRSKAGLYGDVIEEIDWSVGQILKVLDELGIDEKTMVIFTSDNGPWFEGSAGELRQRKGGASWEGGFRVPFTVRWPGQIPPGVTSDAISMNFDLFPTLLELAGAEIPTDREIDGKNIWSLLQGSHQSPHEYLYLFNNEEITAVRSQRWKFVVRSYYRTGLARFEGERRGEPHYYHPGLLFDLELNPEEQFSYTREQPEIVEKMLERLERGRQELEVLGNQ
jgi:arylsulfatase A